MLSTTSENLELPSKAKKYKKTAIGICGKRIYVKNATDKELKEINSHLIFALRAAEQAANDITAMNRLIQSSEKDMKDIPKQVEEKLASGFIIKS